MDKIKIFPPSKLVSLFILVIIVSFFSIGSLILKNVIQKKISKKKKDISLINRVLFLTIKKNSNIGFSYSPYINRLFPIPKKISAKRFDTHIIKKYSEYSPKLLFLLRNYQLGKNKKYFYLTNNALKDKKTKLIINKYLSFVGFRSIKWVVLVTIQFVGILFLILLYFRVKLYRVLAPLLVIISGGMGNLLDRFIHGFVIDYIFFPFLSGSNNTRVFVFNFDDFFIVGGAIALIVILIFFYNAGTENRSVIKDSKKVKNPTNEIPVSVVLDQPNTSLLNNNTNKDQEILEQNNDEENIGQINSNTDDSSTTPEDLNDSDDELENLFDFDIENME